MKTKESIILAALDLAKYERKQVAAVLIASTLTPIAIKDILAICAHIARDKEEAAA